MIKGKKRKEGGKTRGGRLQGKQEFSTEGIWKSFATSDGMCRTFSVLCPFVFHWYQFLLLHSHPAEPMARRQVEADPFHKECYLHSQRDALVQKLLNQKRI